MKYINYTFNIFGLKWQVKFVDTLTASEDAFKFGETNHINSIISIATKDLNKKDLPKEVIQTTLIHEIVHAILGSGQYLSSCDDEPLVEWLAKSIIEINKQKALFLQ